MAKTFTSEAIQRNSEIRGVLPLIIEVRKRLDSGHYDFMTWGSKTKLSNKLMEYENYARESHKSKVPANILIQKQKLKQMEAELRALLGSTY